MGFRFQKRIKIAPGVKLNLSKSGLSTSFGWPGFSHNIGHGKKRTTVGVPGTGLSYSVLHKGKSPQPEHQSQDEPTGASTQDVVIGWVILLSVLGFLVFLFN